MKNHSINLTYLDKEFEVICDKTRKGITCGYLTKHEDGYTHYYINVKFYDTKEIKPYYYPDAFQVHLTAVDKNIQREIITPPIVHPPHPKRLVIEDILGTNSKDIYTNISHR